MFSAKRHWPLYLFIGLCLLETSCNRSSRTIITAAQIPVENTPIILPEEKNTDNIPAEIPAKATYKDWAIRKKSIGPIQVGMSLLQVDSILQDYQKQKATSYDFGFGGGSPAYIYSLDESPVIAVVQALNSKKVFAIIALHESLQTDNGIHPKMSVKNLLGIFPQMKFFYDLMNDWEYSEDAGNQCTFVFMTTKGAQIGSYPDPEKGSVAKRTTAEIAWITIQ